MGALRCARELSIQSPNMLRLDTAVVVVVSRVYLQIGTRSESEN